MTEKRQKRQKGAFSELVAAVKELKRDFNEIKKMFRLMEKIMRYAELGGVSGVMAFMHPLMGMMFFLFTVVLMPIIEGIIERIVKEREHQAQLEEEKKDQERRAKIVAEVREQIVRETRSKYRSVVPQG